MNKNLSRLIIFLVFLSGCGKPTLAVNKPTNEPSTPLQTATQILPTAALQPAREITPVVSPSAEVFSTPVSGGGYPQPVVQSQADLAQRLNISIEQIQVVDIVPKDWSDSCLGISEAGVMCAQMITPGFLVILSSGTTRYEYHTDAMGKNIRLIHQPTLLIEGEKSRILLEWTGSDCEMLSVTTQALFYGTCGVSLKAYPKNSLSDEMVNNWKKTFSSFEADTPAGKIKFKIGRAHV